MAYQLPVTIHTHTMGSGVVHIEYPSISGPVQPQVAHQINQTIVHLVNWMLEQQKKTQSGTLSQMLGHYEIKTNERGILSLTLNNYAYSTPMAHGFTILKSLTFDVNTGKLYELQDLFKPGSNYVEVISKQVSQQLKQRDLPLLDGFTSIHPNQDYYLADKALVIYFQLYEITPYFVGFPMFPISVYDLISIAVEPGPLPTLSADTV
ncbi:DUF3298 domain-containing protein [Paenibacillus psychroresistens]|uniref:DUF3298 domain-containing protein n=1 Tax=Paenibacillus psychroresistens TaxID=1778678 RepID=A0A6B8RH49_9BACL|nr:DUF3298 and DUF4163 domain-containing protein [Paenibacillus psychroresistens]QGQ95054.1 DUF3298 domain-containing protein [Paenibacillus psychroresistens]